MSDQPDFDFDAKGVSAAYDNVLVPVLFEPWAEALLQRVPPDESWAVVDVATGTGIVAQKLAERIGPSGSVTATDLSAEMLSVAKERCNNNGSCVTFIKSPAHPLKLDSDSADALYCQQGFQFFADKPAAAAEMYRVVKPDGQVAVSTWYPVDRCGFFGVIHRELKRMGEDEVADLIGIPFNHMPGEQLVDHFTLAGFENVVLETHEADMVFEEGIEQAYAVSFATPIGPKLKAFSEEKINAFREAMFSSLGEMTKDGVTSGPMTSHVLVTNKPA